MKRFATKSIRDALMASLIFFVLYSLVLPQKSEVFALLNDSQTQRVDSAQKDVLSQNTDEGNSSDRDAKSGREREQHWFRLVKEGNIPVELDTSIVRYNGRFTDPSGVEREISVDLIGAIHLAEKEYYDAINEEFKTYDAVVFELVTGKGVDVKETIRKEREEKLEKKVSPIDFIAYSQYMMSRMLNLCYQLDGIDYLPDNLVRGDMDVEDFIIQLLTNGDAVRFLSDAFFSSFLDNSEGGVLESSAVVLFCSHDRVRAGRRILAAQLYKSAIEDIEKSEQALANPNKEQTQSVLIHLRNKIAIERAVKELKKGKTKLAIFYGAAHLPDLEQRLEKELDMKRDPNTRWLPAWKMR